MRKGITWRERYKSSRNDDSQGMVLIIKLAVSITVVIFTENRNPSKSLKYKPKKTCEQPPPTQKETKYKSHKRHIPSYGSMNKTNLCLFFSWSPSALFNHPQSFCDPRELLHWQLLLSVPNLWARGLAVRLYLSSWAHDQNSSLLNFLSYSWSFMRVNYKTLWKLYNLCSSLLLLASVLLLNAHFPAYANLKW